VSDLKPIQKLSGEELKAIVDAIVSGYDYDDWNRVLAYKWGLMLANEFNTRQGFRGVVADLVAWTERKGKTRELLALACADNPGNENIKQLATIHRLTQEPGLECALAAASRTPANLEALVNSRSRLIDYSRFISRMRSIGDRICLIETPFKKGTGFLIASDRVLTNYHVVEEVVLNPSLAKEVICSFDYRQTDEGTAPANIKQFGLQANGVLANSPYDKSDVTGVGEPDLDKLDYAVLRLAKAVGNLPRGGDEVRGWFNLVADVAVRPVVAVQDFLVIPQHAGGNPLEIAWGNVISFPGIGNRVRYDVTTASGSSGSPCFTLDLDIMGLHHAAEPASNPRYNQAIPLWVIAKDLEAKTPAY
jgi:Trypsin-like peptidase domain/Effector-associated domain 1